MRAEKRRAGRRIRKQRRAIRRTNEAFASLNLTIAGMARAFMDFSAAITREGQNRGS